MDNLVCFLSIIRSTRSKSEITKIDTSNLMYFASTWQRRVLNYIVKALIFFSYRLEIYSRAFSNFVNFHNDVVCLVVIFSFSFIGSQTKVCARGKSVNESICTIHT